MRSQSDIGMKDYARGARSGTRLNADCRQYVSFLLFATCLLSRIARSISAIRQRGYDNLRGVLGDRRSGRNMLLSCQIEAEGRILLAWSRPSSARALVDDGRLGAPSGRRERELRHGMVRSAAGRMVGIRCGMYRKLPAQPALMKMASSDVGPVHQAMEGGHARNTSTI